MWIGVCGSRILALRGMVAPSLVIKTWYVPDYALLYKARGRNTETLAKRPDLPNVELALACQNLGDNTVAANLGEITLFKEILLSETTDLVLHYASRKTPNKHRFSKG